MQFIKHYTIKCLLNILRETDKKTFKILASFGQILFESPFFSKILHWINPNDQY